MKKSKDTVLVLLLFIISLLVSSCANVVSPAGGPKDITGPKILKAFPPNNSINFKSKNIELVFDEFVQIKENQITISPSLKNAPKYKLRKKTLNIDFQDSLENNTTYSINFGNGITDLNESNPMISSNKYVFSTGPNIDTFIVKGNIINAFDLKKEPDVTVMLYKQCDTLPTPKITEYYAKSNKDGDFEIKNVKGGQYNLFFLKDNNNNLIYDMPDEKIGFIDSCFNLGDTIFKNKKLVSERNFNIRMFIKSNEKQRLLKYESDDYCKLKFIFNKSVEKLSIKLLKTKYPFEDIIRIKNINKTKDTIIYWLKETDSTSMLFQVKDNKSYTDTVEIKLQTRDKFTKENKNKFKLIMASNISTASPFNISTPVQLSFNYPLHEYNYSNIVLTSGKNVVYPDSVYLDLKKQNLYLKYPWKENTKYNLYVPKNMFTDIFGHGNDSLNLNFKTKSLKDYSTILLKLKMPVKNVNIIVQLMDDQDKVLREKYCRSDSTINVKFDFVDPGKYKFKLILDTNKNYIWDTGSIINKIQPEKIDIYPGIVELRANWDYEFEWKVK
ncbi:MAG: Ig-like domain-containing protein [Bacteroidota bacterium]|nr:Ig-like domain-containing protein [Bacteroidota bacterium]